MLSYVLATLPFIQFFLVWQFAARFKRIDSFLHNYALVYLDWFFVPFNFLFPLAVPFSPLILLWLLLGLIASWLMHAVWKSLPKKPAETKLFTSEKGLTPEGWTHFVFMTVQLALIISALLAPASSYLCIMLCVLLAYLLAFVAIVVFVRKIRLRSRFDWPFIVIGIVVVLARLIFSL
ncbi:MAG: hypothetical protein V1725_01140 [archaeon]